LGDAATCGTCHEYFGESHLTDCDECGDKVCEDHGRMDPILEETTCETHLVPCGLCEQSYAPGAIVDGRCETCQALGSDTATVPEVIGEEFRSTRAAENHEYLVVYGKRLIRSNQLVVVDRRTDTEVTRRTIGVVDRLRGVFK
jgi:hypothetical protein